jgi:hypothetical protein
MALWNRAFKEAERIDSAAFSGAFAGAVEAPWNSLRQRRFSRPGSQGRRDGETRMLDVKFRMVNPGGGPRRTIL